MRALEKSRAEWHANQATDAPRVTFEEWAWAAGFRHKFLREAFERRQAREPIHNDLFGGAYPDVQPPEGLGQDARRTWRQKRDLDRGVHPATRLPLAGVEGRTCGNCDQRWHKSVKGFEGWKCDEARGVSNDGPDIRLWWPACVDWKAEQAEEVA